MALKFNFLPHKIYKASYGVKPQQVNCELQLVYDII